MEEPGGGGLSAGTVELGEDELFEIFSGDGVAVVETDAGPLNLVRAPGGDER